MRRLYVNIGSQVVAYDILSDTVGDTHYIGRAVSGTPTTGQWTITRIVVTLDGSVDVRLGTGEWGDRYTIIYS